MTDTIPGESLMTVPLIVVNQDQLRLPETYLCFQVHGAAFQYFNLISDHCLSVNAHYKAANRYMNIIDSITVRAVNNAGSCVNIEINAPTCNPLIDGTEYHQSYTLHGIAVRLRSHGTRVSVPNCGSGRVVMQMTCQNYWITNPVTGQRKHMDVIKLVVTHGASLQATSHGLLGEFQIILMDWCYWLLYCGYIYIHTHRSILERSGVCAEIQWFSKKREKRSKKIHHRGGSVLFKQKDIHGNSGILHVGL